MARLVDARAGVRDDLHRDAGVRRGGGVDSTQQSVDTPASSIVAAPTRSASSGPHVEKVVRVTVGPVGCSSGTTSQSGASGGWSANAHWS